MPTSLTIRTALPSDAEALTAYIAAIVAERLPVLFARAAPPALEQVARMIVRNADDERSALFVAVESGGVIGMLDFSPLARPQQRHVGSFGMSVAHSARGRGIGTQLLRALYAFAKDARLSPARARGVRDQRARDRPLREPRLRARGPPPRGGHGGGGGGGFAADGEGDLEGDSRDLQRLRRPAFPL